VAFPLMWAGGWLRDAAGWDDLATAVTLSLLALGGAALGQWPPGAVIDEIRIIPVAPSVWQVRVGLCNTRTGGRLPASADPRFELSLS